MIMWCPKCKECDFDKLKVIEIKPHLTINIYTNHQEENTLLTIKCISCGNEFKEEI